MKSLPETLPNETNVLHKMVLDCQSTVDQLKEKLKWYEEQFRLFQHQRFGASSEKCPDQMELFNEAEPILDALKQGDSDLEESISYQRKRPGRKLLSKHIPREVVRYLEGGYIQIDNNKELVVFNISDLSVTSL